MERKLSELINLLLSQLCGLPEPGEGNQEKESVHIRSLLFTTEYRIRQKDKKGLLSMVWSSKSK